MSLLDYSFSDFSLGGGGSLGSGDSADSSGYTLGNVQASGDSGSGFNWTNAGNFVSGLIDKGTAAYNTIKGVNASTAYGASASGRPEAYAYNGYQNRDLFAPGGGGGSNMLPLLMLGGVALAVVLLIERK